MAVTFEVVQIAVASVIFVR